MYYAKVTDWTSVENFLLHSDAEVSILPHAPTIPMQNAIAPFMAHGGVGCESCRLLLSHIHYASVDVEISVGVMPQPDGGVSLTIFSHVADVTPKSMEVRGH